MLALNSTDVGLIVAGAGKLLIEFADSMPPLGPEATYRQRWAYAFMQRIASNGAKAEAARVPQEKP